MQPKHNFSVFNNLNETEKFTQAFAANFSFFLYCIWLMNLIKFDINLRT